MRFFAVVGIFAVPTVIPLIVSQSMFFPFITGKGFTFRILIEIVFFVWLILALRHKSYRPKFSWVAFLALIFIVVLFLADIFAENPQKALWSNYERMEGFVSIFHMFLYFVVAGSVLSSERLWLYFFRANIFTGIFLGFYGFFQLAGKITINQGGVRVDGTLGNAAYFGGYMLLIFFLSLFLFVRDRNFWWRFVYGISALFSIIILFNTATRGAIIGLMGGFILSAVLIAFFEKENDRKTLRNWFIGLAVAMIAIYGIFYVLRDSEFVQNNKVLSRITSVSSASADAKARFAVWGMAWQGFKERPIVGWGQEGFNFVFNKYYDPDMYLREQWFDRTHNIVFDWLIAAGFLGFVSYFALFASAVMYLWGLLPTFMRKRAGQPVLKFSQTERAILTGLLAAYLFQNFFVFDNVVSYSFFFALLAFIHFSHSTLMERFEKFENVSSEDAYRFYLPIASVFFVAVVWMVNGKSALAATDLINALRQQPAGVEKNLEYFNKALGRGGFGEQEIREQIGQAASNIILSGSNAISPEMKTRFLSLAIEEMKKQTVEVPTDARSQVFLGSLFSTAGSPADSNLALGKALVLSPNKQVIKLQMASNYLRLGDGAKAIEMARSAYESAPQFKDVAASYLIVMIYAGDEDRVENLIKDVFGGKMPADNRLVQVFLEKEEYDRAIEAAQSVFLENPADFQAIRNLAFIYLRSGRKKSAVSFVKEIIDKGSAFKEEGESLLKEIELSKGI